MPRFEVFVPASPPKLPIDLTLRIDAEHWLAALKTGLQRIGERQMANNVLCDIQGDGSIHVTDPDSGRVFRIQEQPQATVTAPPAPPPVAPARVSAPAPRPPPPPATPAAPLPQPRPQAAAPRPPAPEPPPPVAPRVAPRPSAEADRVEEARGPATPASPKIGRLTQAVRTEDVLADLFLEVTTLQGMKDRRAGLGFVLDLAMRTIGCEAGSVFITDLGSAELRFAAVRGPTAEKIMRLGLTVPVGVGIVGFCAQENVCLAVSDAEKDPRFHRAVSEAVGYATRSLLCAPLASGGRVLGALEVLNKKGSAPFSQEDLAVLSYLAAQAAAFLVRMG